MCATTIQELSVAITDSITYHETDEAIDVDIE